MRKTEENLALARPWFKTLVLATASEYNTQTTGNKSKNTQCIHNDVVETKKVMHSKEKQSTEWPWFFLKQVILSWLSLFYELDPL